MPPADPAAVDTILLLLARGARRAQINAALYELDLDAPAAAATLAEASRQLVAAAAIAKNEALGAAITRAADLFTRAMRKKALGVALAASKEHAKLLGLYQPNQSIEPDDTDAEARESAELAAIAAHLRPLQLVPDSAPLAEAARVAAQRIIEITPDSEASDS